MHSLQKLRALMFWHMSQTCAAYAKNICDKCQKRVRHMSHNSLAYVKTSMEQDFANGLTDGLHRLRCVLALARKLCCHAMINVGEIHI